MKKRGKRYRSPKKQNLLKKTVKSTRKYFVFPSQRDPRQSSAHCKLN